MQDLAGVAEAPGATERRGYPGSAFELDDQDRQPGSRGQVGQSGDQGGLADP